MANFHEREKEILSFWEKKKIFEKTLVKDAPKGNFVFYEGPPTANGKPGIHSAESRAFKDCIPRFRTMQGYHVERKGGWDTHGLPVELEVEKQLGFKSKREIEEYGIAEFNAKCKESVWKYKKEWEEFTRRLGFWVDLEHAYITYESSYIESLWWIIKQVWDKGLLYKDYRVTPHCPRCETSLSSHEMAQGYKEVKDLSIIAKFRLIPPLSKGGLRGVADEIPTFLLAWTTTPWTLPGNVGLAVGGTIEYVKVRVIPPLSSAEGGSASGGVGGLGGVGVREEYYWMAKDRLSIVKGEFEVVEEVKGKALIGWEYEPLFSYLSELVAGEQKEKLEKNAYRVYEADFVTTDEGTGIVHTAVMYGADDFELGTRVGLPKHHMVDLSGHFVTGCGFLSGRFVKEEGLDVEIIKDLAHRGLLFSKEKYEHSYPHCWRCKTPLIYYAKDSWYIKMSSLREEMIRQNENIHWEPAHIKDGRFGEWLREVKDWAFSRERYWGTPLPIWVCQQCKKQECVGSFDELFEKAVPPLNKGGQGGVFDPHRPFVDDIILSCSCGGKMKRVPDVCDVWFDSGSMPFAQHHYPFENKEKIDGRGGSAYPADYISEAIDQTRGWFYTLLAVATLLGRERPFKNVICLGHILDAERKKMSKSLGNIVEPMQIMETYGADAVRWYMYSINQPGESKRFDEKALQEMVRQNFGILMNVVAFYKTYEKEGAQGAHVAHGAQGAHVLDRWVMARLDVLIRQTTEQLEQYKITEPVRAIGDFINDLSTWYLRRSRERFKVELPPLSARGGSAFGGGKGGQGGVPDDKRSALLTLKTCLLELSKLMAPFAPFIAEDIYGQVGGEKESVHLEDWPSVILNPPKADEGSSVLERMSETRALVSLALEQRAKAGINIRQALAGMIITTPSGTLGEEYLVLLKDEVNVKTITFGSRTLLRLWRKGAPSERTVVLDTALTPELIREGLVREIVRRVNAMRKNAGLNITDRILLSVQSEDDEVRKAIQEYRDDLLSGTLADDLVEDTSSDTSEQFKVGEFSMKIGFTKKQPDMLQ